MFGPGPSPGAGGSLFDGVAFWVAQRVPIRASILQMITDNGGRLVPREPDADLLIADHARRDAPAEAYSWKLVTESIQAGILLAPDGYLIHSTRSRLAPSAATAPAHARVPFTPADDAALARLLLAQPANQTGNKIYMDFALQNSRHTWQSWRNRYVKHLKYLSLHQLKKLASTPLEAINAKSGSSPAPPPLPTFAEKDRARSRSSPNTRQPSTPPPTSPPAASIADPSSGQLLERPSPSLKDQFLSDLRVFADVSDAPFQPLHLIAGRPLHLWDLSQAVAALGAPPSPLDWSRVATTLGFDTARHPDVATDLRRCYEDHLVDFFDAVATFDLTDHDQLSDEVEAVDDESSASPSTSAKDPQQHQEAGPESSAPCSSPSCDEREDALPSSREEAPPSSSPSTPSPAAARPPKLRLGSPPAKAAKRGRLPSDAEIPSTPEEALTVADRPSDSLPASPQSPLDPRPAPTAKGRKRPLPSSFRSASTEGSPRPKRVAKEEPEEAREEPEEANKEPQEAREEAKETKDGEEETRIREVVLYYQSLGYPHRIVVEALKRTTMVSGRLAVLVMQSLLQSRPVPSHLAGVWTDDDDATLQRIINGTEPAVGLNSRPPWSNSGSDFNRLAKKHGLARIQLRRQFLAASAAIEESSTTTS